MLAWRLSQFYSFNGGVYRVLRLSCPHPLYTYAGKGLGGLVSLCLHVCCRVYAPGCLEHLSCGSRRRAVCQGCPVRVSKRLLANSLITFRRKGFRLPWTARAEQTPERISARAVGLLLRQLHRSCQSVLSPCLLVHVLRSGRDSKCQQGSVFAKCMHPALPIAHALEALPLAHAISCYEALHRA